MPTPANGRNTGSTTAEGTPPSCMDPACVKAQRGASSNPLSQNVRRGFWGHLALACSLAALGCSSLLGGFDQPQAAHANTPQNTTTPPAAATTTSPTNAPGFTVVDAEGPPLAVASTALAKSVQELSGITWLGGNRYWAVGDNKAEIVELNVAFGADLMPTSAAIVSVAPIRPRFENTRRPSDLEAIAVLPIAMRSNTNDHAPDHATQTAAANKKPAATPTPTAVWVAEEAGRVHKLTAGDFKPVASDKQTAQHNTSADANTATDASTDALVAHWDMPPRPVFSWSGPPMRGNRGIEAMTLDADGQLWLANEDATAADGPVASFDHGARVRIVTFRNRSPRLQTYFYDIDSVNGDNPLTKQERSGLVDLAALPDGRLLVLERAAGLTGFRSRLYLVAPDENNVNQVLSKTPLWERHFLQINANFEGLALGPVDGEGNQSLLLIADQNGQGDHLLYGLVLRPEPPAPTPTPGSK